MKVYELLDSREKWTQNAIARDATGLEVPANDPTAVCWCFFGALEKCDLQGMYGSIGCFHMWLGLPMSTWNDAPFRTWEEVVELAKRLDI